MWFEMLMLTLCILVSSVEVNKSWEPKLFEDLNNGNCDGDFPWILTEYKYLGIVPFNDYNTKCIQATSKSCATLYPIDLSRGAIELNVYLKLFLNESGLKVTVFNENYVPVRDYELNRLKKYYTEGWNKILLHTEDSTVGYINLKGSTDKGEFIVLDLYQYTEYISTKKTLYELVKTKFHLVKENLDSLQLLNRTTDSVINVTTNFNKHYSKNRLIRSIEGTSHLSNDLTSEEKANPIIVTTIETLNKQDELGESLLTTELPTKELEQSGITVTTEPLTEQDENTVNSKPLTMKSEQEDNTTATDSESTANMTKDDPKFNRTDDSTGAIETDSDALRQATPNNFWTPATITLAAVGSFVVLAVTAVSAYHCGKMRARKVDTDFIMEEDVIPPPIIPRVRNANRFEV